MALRLSHTRQLSYGNYYLMKNYPTLIKFKDRIKNGAQIIALAVYVKHISKTLAIFISQIPSP